MEATLLIASAIAQIREEALLASSQYNGHFEFFESTVDNALGYYTSHSSPTRFFLSRARFVLTTAGELVPLGGMVARERQMALSRKASWDPAAHVSVPWHALSAE